MEQSLSREASSRSANKLLDFYVTQKFIIQFTRARHWSLSWESWIHFIPSQPNVSL